MSWPLFHYLLWVSFALSQWTGVISLVWKIFWNNAGVSWYGNYRTGCRVTWSRLNALQVSSFKLNSRCSMSLSQGAAKHFQMSGRVATSTQLISFGSMRLEILWLEGKGALLWWEDLLLVFTIGIEWGVLVTNTEQSTLRSNSFLAIEKRFCCALTGFNL